MSEGILYALLIILYQLLLSFFTIKMATLKWPGLGVPFKSGGTKVRAIYRDTPVNRETCRQTQLKTGGDIQCAVASYSTLMF